MCPISSYRTPYTQSNRRNYLRLHEGWHIKDPVLLWEQALVSDDTLYELRRSDIKAWVPHLNMHSQSPDRLVSLNQNTRLGGQINNCAQHNECIS